jgi:hypothetical protein
VTVSQLLDLYMPLAEWDVSTREGYEGYVRRTIRTALGRDASPAVNWSTAFRAVGVRPVSDRLHEEVSLAEEQYKGGGEP